VHLYRDFLPAAWMASLALSTGQGTSTVSGSTPSEEDLAQALRLLSPHDWAPLVGVLGASLRPVNGEGAFTVTSLLSSIDQPVVQESTAEPSLCHGRSSASAQRTRRARQRPVHVSAPKAEEDTRDIDELLRELGEKPAVATSKRKGRSAVTTSSQKGTGTRVATSAVGLEEGPSGSSTAPATSLVSVEESAELDQSEASSQASGSARGDGDSSKLAELATAQAARSFLARGPSPCRAGVRSRSEGALPEACSSATSDAVAPSFSARPSVATWLRSAPVGRAVESTAVRLCTRSSSPLPSNPELAGEQNEAPRAWRKRPSVGTWLAPVAPRAEAVSRDRSRELQLWPDTPMSTPAVSPQRPHLDNSASQVVWVPVPVQLLGEVQKVLMRGVVPPCPAI